jgi:hypothetical protein
VIVAALLLALAFADHFHNTIGQAMFRGDDVMRMVTVKDLLGGQPWQDTVEHRDNAPYGASMHWSRLVDAPIAGIGLTLAPLLGPAGLVAAANIWPPILLVLLLALSVPLTRRFVGWRGDVLAVVLPLGSVMLLAEFMPAHVHHHNIQIVLTTALMFATLAGRTEAKWAALAGVLTATSLAIGAEALPLAGAAIVCFGLFWALDRRAAGPVRWFAVALALSLALHLVVAAPPSNWFTPACDALSITFVAGGALCSAALGLATVVGRRLAGWQARLLLVAGLGLVAGVGTLMLFPDCIRGPYAVLNDPHLARIILGNVGEARPLWTWFATDLVDTICICLLSFLGLAIIARRIWVTHGDQQIEWLALGVFLLFALIITMMEFRGLRLAIMPAVPAGAWFVVDAWQRHVRRPGAIAMARVCLRLLALASIPLLAITGAVAGALSPSKGTALLPPPPACMTSAGYNDPAAYARLASLPKGIVVGPMVLGPRILLYTDDSVVATGYHRNVEGARDTDTFLNGGEAAARAIAARRGVNYVVTCAGLAQLDVTPAAQPDSFVALHAAGHHWNWLKPLSSHDEALQIYRVDIGS